MNFEVLDSFAAVQPWLSDVCRAADAHRLELGFLPRNVFEQFARRDGLYVLVAHSNSGTRFAGHLLFDRSFPRAHVRQMFAESEFRRQGVASQLLAHLARTLTQSSFISIYARVAEDLMIANAFWQRQQFYVQRTVKGGATRNRQIHVRCYELDSPQLFPNSGLDDHDPLGISGFVSHELPMFLLDMNVLFDVQPRRLRRAEVIGLFQAERMNYCRLAISDEIRKELERNLTADKTTDPMAALVDTYPSVPVGAVDIADSDFIELAKLVFPGVVGQRDLNANEKSDICHVLAVIRNDLAGLITHDGALLSAGPEIARRFRIKIQSAAYFQVEEPGRESEILQSTKHEDLRLLVVPPESEPNIREFLVHKVRLSGSEISANWLSLNQSNRIATRFAVWSGRTCIACLTCPSGNPAELLVARAAVDESHMQATEAARILLMFLIDRVGSAGPRHVRLELPTHQSKIREIAATFGFVGSPGQNYLVKSILGQVITESSWATSIQALAGLNGPKLPPAAPAFRGIDQLVPVLTPIGDRAHVSIDTLESLLSPCLFCLSGRPAVIAPVRRTYAEPLLGHARQGSLLPQSTVSLFTERLYLSDPSTLRHFRRGTLVFFYESGKDKGRSQLVAVARVRESYLKRCDALALKDLQQSVLTPKHLLHIGKSSLKTVMMFDNIFHIPEPVNLRVLQSLGCGRPNDLITTHAITDEQLKAILIEGFGRAG